MSTYIEKKRKGTLRDSSDSGEEAHKHPKWNSSLRNALAKRKTEEALTQMRDGSCIVIYTGDTLYTALGTMITDKISSVPLMDKDDKKKCVGFVDMLDVVSATVQLLEEGPAAEHFKNISPKPITQKERSVSEQQSKEDKKKMDEEDDENTALEFLEQIVVESIGAQAITDISSVDTFVSVPHDMSLLHAAEQLAKPNQQRIAVVDKDKNFLGVITQSGFAEWLSEEFTSHMKKIQKRKVEDMKLQSKLHTIRPEDTAFHAFKTMKEEKVHTLGICNSRGVLVDVISSSDLILWTEWIAAGEVFRFSDFSALKTPVDRYLEESRTQREIPSRKPITCMMDSTLDDVIATMLYKNVHRLFVVDETNSPVGVVTYSDIIAELVSEH